MKAKKVPILESDLRRFYVDEQWSMADIAKHFNCSVQTICNYVEKAGIQPRSSSCSSKKRSLAKLGNKNPMFGTKRPEHGKYISKLRKGTVFSDATRKKMSESRKGKYTGPLNGKWIMPHLRKSPLYKQIRDCVRMQEWRTSVFERDNFTCKGCSKRGGILNADHIKQFAIILKENDVKTLENALECTELWNLANGRTLCDTCHRQTDTFAKHVS